jgi:hypothetical protein
MRNLVIYIRKLVSLMISKIWLIWESGSGVIALMFWLIPEKISDWLLQESDFLLWWITNGKWVGLGIFGFVSIFLAPYLAWKDEHSARLEAENKWKQLKSEDAELERKLKQEQLKREEWENLSRGNIF